MMRMALALTVVLLLLFSVVAETRVVDLAFANFMPISVPAHNIEITADGNVTGTDKIQREENVYTFSGNILGSIVVFCDNIVIDGAGYTLQGNGYLYGIFLEGRKAVVVRNMTITGFDRGVVYSYYRDQVDSDCRGNIVIGNNITNNRMGIDCYFSFNITISENAITDNKIGVCGFDATGISMNGNFISGNDVGIDFSSGSDVKVFGNDFVNNTSQAIVDHRKAEGYVPLSTANFYGNFWSDYNGTDGDGNGIGDTPYSIDNSTQDNYPLMYPSEMGYAAVMLASYRLRQLALFKTALVAAPVVTGAFIGAGLLLYLLYFKKRNRARINKQGEIEQSST